MPRFPRFLPAFLLLLCPALRADDPKQFERWEKEIAAFEKQDQAHPPRPNGIVFIGSSSIRLWKLDQSFPGKTLINRGFGGSQIADSVHFAPRLVLRYKPRLIVFYAGDNDIASGKTPERVLSDFKRFVQVVHKDLPETRIIFLSIKASPKRWSMFERQTKANKLVEEYCKSDRTLTYLDLVQPTLDREGKPRLELFAKDELHLNAEGYRIWARLLEPLLK